jgi:hypothetical protein
VLIGICLPINARTGLARLKFGEDAHSYSTRSTVGGVPVIRTMFRLGDSGMPIPAVYLAVMYVCGPSRRSAGVPADGIDVARRTHGIVSDDRVE